MNSFYCENQGTYTYMVYELAPNEELDNLSLGMMINNKIRGISPVIRTQMDQIACLKYNVSAKVSLTQYLTGTLSRERILKIFLSITEAVLMAEEYMIDRSSFLFDPDFIFVNVSTAEAEIICLPVIGLAQPDISSFFKNIMFNPNTTFDSTENCDYVAKIINHLNSATTFSLGNFRELLVSLQRNQAVGQPQAQSAAAIMNNQRSQQQPVQPMTQTQNRAAQAQPVVNKTVMPQQKINQHPTTSQQQGVAVPQMQPVAQKTQGAAPIPDMGFAIPGASPEQMVPSQGTGRSGAPVQNTVTSETDEKPMSMLYLLRNYSKENAAIYKAQKQAQKDAAPAKEDKKAKKGRKKDKDSAAESFSVPGSPNVDMGFAIPGTSPEQIPNVQAMPSQNSVYNQVPNGSQGMNQMQNAANVYAQPVQQQMNVQPQVMQQAPVQQTMPNIAPVQNGSGNFGETTVLNAGSYGETTVLNQAQNPQQMITPRLIRAKNNEKILINKPAYRIGKERSYVDYFIGDNTAISRSHANILIRDGQYFVVDTNSTNHTFVNGQMIQSNMEVQINHGDKIRLANEDFEFKLY